PKSRNPRAAGDRASRGANRKVLPRLPERETHSCDRDRSARKKKEAREQPRRRVRGPTRKILFLAPPCVRPPRETRVSQQERLRDIRRRVPPKVDPAALPISSADRDAELQISWLPAPALSRRPGKAARQSSRRRFPVVCGCPGRFRGR